MRHWLTNLHLRGLYFIACDEEASQHYGIDTKGFMAMLWRVRCYLRGVLGIDFFTEADRTPKGLASPPSNL